MAKLSINRQRATPADIVNRSVAFRRPGYKQHSSRTAWRTDPVVAIAGKGLGLKPTLIAGGRVVVVTTRGRCKVRHKKAHLWVRWFNNQLPPGVKKGSSVVFIGALLTFNNGTSFQVLDAVLLKTSPRRILKEMRRVMGELVEFPNPEDFAKAEPR